MNTDAILHLTGQHPEHKPLILLSAISVLWLEPQNPSAAALIRRYRECDFSFAALREAALQLFLLAGFQASLEAAFQIEEIYGHGLNESGTDQTNLKAAIWYERGKELQAEVYRGNVEKLRVNLERVSPELSVWTVLIGYGLVMSRPGMPAHWRELLEVAVLSVQGFSRQLHSHLLGALNLGASSEEVDLVLNTTGSLASKERHDAALRMWRRLRP